MCPSQVLPLGPRGPAGLSYSPLISCPSSHRGPPEGLHLPGSPARCQVSCLRVASLTLSPGTQCGCRALGSSPVHGGTHGRGQGPSSSAAVPRRGHTGESTPQRWHMGRWGSGTGPGCRWPRTPRHPPAGGTEQRLGPAGCGDRCPPGETEAGGSVLCAVSVGTPALQPFPRPGSPLPLRFQPASRPPACPSSITNPSSHPSLPPSIHLSFHSSVHLSIHISIHPSLQPATHPSAQLLRTCYCSVQSSAW